MVESTEYPVVLTAARPPVPRQISFPVVANIHCINNPWFGHTMQQASSPVKQELNLSLSLQLVTEPVPNASINIASVAVGEFMDDLILVLAARMNILFSIKIFPTSNVVDLQQEWICYENAESSPQGALLENL